MPHYILTAADLPGMIVTEAVTGRRRIGGTYINEPLTDCCDWPVADGPCACERMPGESAGRLASEGIKAIGDDLAAAYRARAA